LHPVSVSGRFHPKIYLFLSKAKGKLIFGSANLTRAGLTSNAELVSCYEYEADKKGKYLSLFVTAFQYIKKVCDRWPAETLLSNINNVERNVPWLSNEKPAEDNRLRLLHNLDEPLWAQLREGFKIPVDRIRILSRYFDEEPSLLDKLQEDYEPKKILIYTQNGTTTLSRKWFGHKLVKSGKASIHFCDYQDMETTQWLHAKSISIEKGRFQRLIFGSANFTTSALTRTPTNGNAEFVAALDLNSTDIDTDRFFDPGNTSVQAASPAQLVMGDRKKECRKHFEIRVHEAQLSDDRILIDWSSGKEYKNCQFRALIMFHEGAFVRIGCITEQDGRLSAQVSAEISVRLGNSSSTIQLEVLRGGENPVATSNPILITNLIDIDSGKSIRKTRAISEAEQSPGQFSQILSELLHDSDERNLLDFLNYCDIPFIDDKRHRITLRKRGLMREEAMRKLGEINLKYFSILHKAAMYFLERHLNKLLRHCKCAGIHGIYNFFHIFSGMSDVIDSQVGRALIGLEAASGPLSIDDWALYRDQMEDYYDVFGKMMDVLWNDYLSEMIVSYPRQDIKDRVEPDINQIRAICDKMHGYRERFENLRLRSLRVRTLEGQLLVPEYFSCVFGADQWGEYKEGIELNLKNTEAVL
jgi:HKD family nuclease